MSKQTAVLDTKLNEVLQLFQKAGWQNTPQAQSIMAILQSFQQQQEPQQTITPGGCPPGTYLFAGECIDPGTGQPVVDPETQQPIMPPQGSGFDLSGILDNPLILIGGAALLFFFFMKD